MKLGTMDNVVTKEREVNPEYLKKLEKIRKGKFIKCYNIKDLLRTKDPRKFKDN